MGAVLSTGAAAQNEISGEEESSWLLESPFILFASLSDIFNELLHSLWGFAKGQGKAEREDLQSGSHSEIRRLNPNH